MTITDTTWLTTSSLIVLQKWALNADVLKSPVGQEQPVIAEQAYLIGLEANFFW